MCKQQDKVVRAMGRQILRSYNSRGSMWKISISQLFYFSQGHEQMWPALLSSQNSGYLSRCPPGHRNFCPQWLCSQIRDLQKKIKSPQTVFYPMSIQKCIYISWREVCILCSFPWWVSTIEFEQYLLRSPGDFRFAAQCFSFWKGTDKMFWFEIFAWWSWHFPGMEE